MEQRTLPDVVADLTRIVATCRAEGSQLGVFPAMYRAVTVTVGDAIGADAFDDDARVERLVTVFADLYIDAFDAWRRGDPVPQVWELAFAFAASGRGSICQHLLLGMNAHINLDLAVAAARVCTEEELPDFHDDFVRVNDVLFALLDELQAALGSVSPWMAALDRLGVGFDEACMRTGIARARAGAWELAEVLVAADPADRERSIADQDADARRLGQLVCHRFSGLHLANRVISWRECRDRTRVIDTIGSTRIDVLALLVP